MQTSIFLARLLGPILLLAGISILFNHRVFRTMAAEVAGSLTLVYLFGFIDLAAGLAIVLTHSIWTLHWYVLITLLGWLMLLRGAARILVPETIMNYASKVIGNKQFFRASGTVLVVLGLVLCFFGYVR